MSRLDVENTDREIRDMLTELKKKISKVEDLNETHNDSDLKYINKKIIHCKNRIKYMEMTLRTMKDRDFAKQYRAVVRNHQSKLDEYEQNMKWVDDHLTDKERKKQAGQFTSNDILNNEDNAIKYGNKLLNETDDAADRTIQVVNQIQANAAETAEMVANQTKQLNNINNELDSIDEEIDRASKVMKRMGRRVMTDKYIWVLISLIFIAIIVAVVLAFTKGKLKKEDLTPDF
mmetsp:Transcript_28051/g.34250  ORF Transcript_28051/g.34250 Transcript_28051/m.34250 type:complete len:232 (+) Transcript_28051:36-731(+)